MKKLGYDTKLLQHFAGHSSNATTDLYTHMSKEDLGKDFETYAAY